MAPAVFVRRLYINALLDCDYRAARLALGLKERKESSPQTWRLDPGVTFRTELRALRDRAGTFGTIHIGVQNQLD